MPTTTLTSQLSASNLQTGSSSPTSTNMGAQRPTSRFSAYESASMLNGNNNTSANNLAALNANGRSSNVKRSFSQVPSSDRVGYQRNSTTTLTSSTNTVTSASSGNKGNELKSTMSNPISAPVTFSLGPSNNNGSSANDDRVVR